MAYQFIFISSSNSRRQTAAMGKMQKFFNSAGKQSLVCFQLAIPQTRAVILICDKGL
jgi:hypothetical protein